MPLLLGCIADDFTGATDLANTLVKHGMSAVQVIGVPDGPLPDADAVIIALKIRTKLVPALPSGLRGFPFAHLLP